MSYILDAIKKSEAERGHGSIPSLQTVHSSSLSYTTQSKPLWPYLLIGLLLINSGGLIYYFSQTNNNTNQINTIQTKTYTTPIEKQQSTAQIIIRPTPVIQQVIETYSEPATTPQPQVIAQQKSITMTRPAVSNEVLNIEDLPSHIKQRIPTLEFSGHIYSSSSSFRSIIINGSFKEEGDAINHEFTLSEITPKGAIFEYQGTLFEVSILTGWNVN